MRTYYLFIIRSVVKNAYKNDARSIYNSLNAIKNDGEISLNYKYSLYTQLCVMFQPDVIDNYFKYIEAVKVKKNKYLYKQELEYSLLELNQSSIVIVTNMNIPSYFRILNYYNKSIFVCDFINNDYFWLEEHYNKKKLYEYN